ncbi:MULTISPECIES: hypothetical protein [Vibrio]|uniref:hypothetical protein n=1 Tax=Vibrio TaxID=662 RepID=UPI0004DEFA03|nr:hypothetical protein [Vibrio parahaemolyticus]EGQ9239983.1 hypothetical protein [Vibrio vulnificus]EHD1697951.1 hypothetical protein [Vibrio vulnificus]EKZ9225750.1 hypothetical protein [Vibrio vulnificus]ELC9582596.1 hypothetical protein [Vibrio vulnificus]MCU8150243.1 hypothetical protein [Vibrio vulnificus]
MLHTHGIKQEEVITNGRFNLGLFKQRLIDVTQVGQCIYPKAQARLAKQLGALGDSETITKNVVFSFNSGDSRLKRRIVKGVGYVYEKIAD